MPICMCVSWWSCSIKQKKKEKKKEVKNKNLGAFIFCNVVIMLWLLGTETQLVQIAVLTERSVGLLSTKQ